MLALVYMPAGQGTHALSAHTRLQGSRPAKYKLCASDDERRRVRTRHRHSGSPRVCLGLVDTLWLTAAQQAPANLLVPSSPFRCRGTRQTARQQLQQQPKAVALDLGQAVVKVLGLLAREDGLVLLRHSRSG